jgi:undecaprenyl pyrophosphate synthase
MLNSSRNSLKRLAIQMPNKEKTIFENIKPILFDVSLRNDFPQMSLNVKKNLFYNILWNHNPDNVEIGSLLNPEIMPRFLSSLELFKELNEENENMIKFWGKNTRENIYMALNNSEKLNLAIKKNIKCFSLTIPIHSNFPRSQKELKQIFDVLQRSVPENKTKLYISSTNEWTEEGVIDSDYIIHKLLNYYEKYEPDLLCLSDTFGLLDSEEYEYIVDNCIYFGLPSSKICVNLHFNHNNKKQIANAKRIIHHSLHKKIKNFDVSKQYIDFYGSAMIKKNERISNLSYELFNDFLKEYIELLL